MKSKRFLVVIAVVIATIEVFREGMIKKRIHGYNAGPDNWAQFLKLKKFAMEHSAAIHAE